MKYFSPAHLGAESLGDGRTSFTVWAPFAEAVTVVMVSPEEQLVPLSRMKNGYHQGIAESVGLETRYFYRLHKKGQEGENVEQWPDPCSRFQPEGVHGPSQVVDKAFHWQDEAWSGLSLSQYIICEIHVGVFTPEGTFDAVISHLDRLKDVGFTALELMPVAQFPGSRNWGYDGVYPFSVQNTYGGPAGLKRLVNACHQKGMAAILDVVYNHLGPEGNYLPKFGPYFTDFYRTPWGEAINFDGPDSDAVRRFFMESALQWVTEYRFDALRIDAVHAMLDFSARPFLQELGLAIHKAAGMENRRIYCIAESALNDSRVIESRQLGGLGLDAQWNDDFHHALHTLLTGEQEGYYQDFGSMEHLAKAWQEGFIYSGQHSAFRRRRHGNSSRNLPGRQFVVFAQNHDQVGNRMQGDRFATLISLEKQKLAAVQVLLSPFIPLLFMGEEYGETAPFPYFVSHSDAELVRAVREGRRKEFADFRWKGEPPDPQAESTFLLAKLDPHLAESGVHRTILEFYRELIRLRKEVCCLRDPSKKSMRVHGSGQVLSVHRWSLQDEAFLLFHFGDRSLKKTVPLPAGCWTKLLDSGDRQWSGQGSEIPPVLVSEEGAATDIFLSPHSAAVLYRANPNPCL